MWHLITERLLILQIQSYIWWHVTQPTPANKRGFAPSPTAADAGIADIAAERFRMFDAADTPQDRLSALADEAIAGVWTDTGEAPWAAAAVAGIA